MTNTDKARMLRDNAARFRARARVDRPQRDALLRQARAAESRAAELEGVTV